MPLFKRLRGLYILSSVKTRWVLLEMKAIMSSTPSLHHMSMDGNNWVFFTERWDHKLELSQKVMNTPFAATWQRGLIC